jgi:hypothetical protein
VYAEMVISRDQTTTECGLRLGDKEMDVKLDDVSLSNHRLENFEMTKCRFTVELIIQLDSSIYI